MALQLYQDQRLEPTRPGGALALAERSAGESLSSSELVDSLRGSPRKGQLADVAGSRGSKYGKPPSAGPDRERGDLERATPGRQRQDAQQTEITADDVKNVKNVYDFFAGGDGGVTGIDSSAHLGDTGGPSTSGGQGQGFWSQLTDSFGGGSSGSAVGAGGAGSLSAVPGGSGFGVAGGGAAHSAGVAAVPGGLSNAAVGGAGAGAGAGAGGGVGGGAGAGAGAGAGLGGAAMVAAPLALFLIPLLFGLSEAKKQGKHNDKERAKLGLDTREGQQRFDANLDRRARSIYG